MQSVEFVLRQIGNPSEDGTVISGSDTKEYLQYQYLSQGYELKSEHFLGNVLSPEGQPLGYRFMFILVKNEDVSAPKTSKAK